MHLPFQTKKHVCIERGWKQGTKKPPVSSHFPIFLLKWRSFNGPAFIPPIDSGKGPRNRCDDAHGPHGPILGTLTGLVMESVGLTLTWFTTTRDYGDVSQVAKNHHKYTIDCHRFDQSHRCACCFWKRKDPNNKKHWCLSKKSVFVWMMFMFFVVLGHPQVNTDQIG